MEIHSSAIVDPRASIADDVKIGPFCIIAGAVRIDSGCRLISHVSVHDHVTIGSGNTFHQGCVVGDAPQDYSYDNEATTLEIGNNNTFREYVTVHRGTAKDRGTTTIGDHCMFMAYSHVAHDCIVGDNVLLTNCAQLAGHTELAENCTLSAFTGVHQFCRVGRHAYIGATVIANQDIVPFALAVSDEHNRTTIAGPNLVGLKRAGFSREALRSIRSAFKLLFKSGLNTTQALERIETELSNSPEVREIVNFIGSAKRGISK